MTTVQPAYRFASRSSLLLKGVAKAITLALFPAALVFGSASSLAQYVQQGPKLVYTGEGGEVTQGDAVAVAATNPTVLVGAPFAENTTGLAVVFVRNNGAWTQQGGAIHPTDEIGGAFFGSSVALSADGNTALIGGWADDGTTGAAWVFTRSNGVWTQQAKLIGSDAPQPAQQGAAVALSADGNTAIVGGPDDNTTPYEAYYGAAWVFTRTNGVWTQQAKLVGTGISMDAGFGKSSGLSADGSVAIVGAQNQTSPGAAWVFGRSGNVWTQQAVLIGDSAIGNAGQGNAVALSGEGDTALVGGPFDNSSAGATWVFARSGNTWIQQAKLIASGAIGNAVEQGSSVALPFSDTGPALVGGPGDNNIGAAWIFTRSGGVWTQGQKLIGSGSVGTAQYHPGEGGAVALSQLDSSGSDARFAVLGGGGDTNLLGATWAFAAHSAAATHDFDGDVRSDILWRDTSGELAMWLMSAGQFSSGANIAQVPAVWSVVGTRDFNGDSDADLLWLDSSGDLAVWLMNGASLSSGIGLGNVGTSWKVIGTGDFNGDATGDILWRDTSGDLAIWLMNNGQFSSGVSLGQVSSEWSVAGTGDFNGDGTTDILWRNNQTGDLAIWFVSNGQLSSGIDLGAVALNWSVVGTGDFNRDGTSDILWRDSSGDLATWLMSNGQLWSGATVGQVPTTWSVAGTGDFDGNGTSDILWLNQSGDLAIWLMNGTTLTSGISLGNVGASWQVQGQNAD